MPSVKDAYCLKIVNKTSFELIAPPGVNECRMKTDFISLFYDSGLKPSFEHVKLALGHRLNAFSSCFSTMNKI